MKKSKALNVPNALSLLRVILVPVFMAAVLLTSDMQTQTYAQKFIKCAIPALVFGLTAFTDLLDGKIARKYNLVTDFGKFIDPLADKFMVFGALISILVAYPEISGIFVWVAMLVMLRELAITSLRLVIAGNSGKVLAASWWGKVKTVTQTACILLIIMESAIWQPEFCPHLISYVSMAAMTVATIGSGVDYMRAYIPLIDMNK